MESTTQKVGRLENLTLQERAYQELKNAIMSGQFAPGETITIRALAAELGTSTMPARDAMGRLVAERALEMLPNRKFRIPRFTRKQFMELIDIRILIECRATALAAEHVTDAEIKEITAINASCVKAFLAHEPEQHLVHNKNFHFTIYRAARSELILPIIESLWLMGGPIAVSGFRRMFVHKTEFVHAGLALHEGVIAALARHDPEDAKVRMEAVIAKNLPHYLLDEDFETEAEEAALSPQE